MSIQETLDAIKGARLDADEIIFFTRELKQIKDKPYDKLFPRFTALANMPMSHEVNPGVDTITYHQYDTVGLAKIINNYADDLPRANVKGKEFFAKVKSIGAAYEVQSTRHCRC